MAMDSVGYATDASLWMLGGLLAYLAVRNVIRYRTEPRGALLWWATGLGAAAAAMMLEAVVFVGISAPGLLDAYFFLTAATVAALSIGATGVLGHRRIELGYEGYILAVTAAVGVASFSLPLPDGIVSNGVISGSPSVWVVVLSSLVTFPATILLLAATALAIRSSRQWRPGLIVVGVGVLAAGGTLYIASLPAALYYAEFLGILLLFLGLVSLPHARPAKAPSPAGRPAP